MRGLLLVALVVLPACGPSWTESDARATTAAARAEAAALSLCAAPAASCSAGPVRALTRAAACADFSTLARHGAEVDAGLRCEP